MRKAVIRLRQDTNFADIRNNFSAAWNNNAYMGEVFEFESPSALFHLLTPARWELIEYLQSQDSLAIAELPKPFTKQDITALLDIGLIEQDDTGRLFVPFVEIQADFMLRCAA